MKIALPVSNASFESLEGRDEGVIEMGVPGSMSSASSRASWSAHRLPTPFIDGLIPNNGHPVSIALAWFTLLVILGFRV